MRTLIFSDVHGNLPAFEKMLENVGKCDQYICLGDLVNYGPWSNECVDLALSLPNSTILMGNHESAFLQGFYPGDNKLVKTFFDVTILDFDRVNDIKKFITSKMIGKYTCLHTLNNKYIYPDTSIILNDNYIIGHSHHQFSYRNNGFELYNAGSVGQNRKLINEANYLIIYDQEIVEMCDVVYSVDLLLNEMKRKKYPNECIEYYSKKERA